MSTLSLDLFEPEAPKPAPVVMCGMSASNWRAYRAGCSCRHRDARSRQVTENPYRAGTPEGAAWARGYADAGEFA